MKPLRLYIENFMCYDISFIDFTQFSVALLLGQVETNDCHANGVGKTTIFKAIEYVLFNQSDGNLERIIRDETDACKVVLDFVIGDQEYRISRKRNRKGISDLTLLQRNSVVSTNDEAYHVIKDGIAIPSLEKETVNKFWKDLSGGRAADTEKDLAKLIKIGHKSFRSTMHFVQHDFSGLATATPEKRKVILKEAFNLLVYAKLEKMAKDKAAVLAKEIDRCNTMVSALGDPLKDITEITSQIFNVDQELAHREKLQVALNQNLSDQNAKINELSNTYANLDNKYAMLLAQEKTLQGEKSRLETSVKEYQSKKANVAKAAKDIVSEISVLKEQQTELIAIDYSQIDILSETISSIKEQITQHNVSIKNNMETYDDLKIPLPSGSVCKGCRKPMTDQDRKNHQLHIGEDINKCQLAIQEAKKAINTLNSEVLQHQQIVNSLKLSKQQLEGVNTKISSKNKEVTDKKSLYEEYSNLLAKFVGELDSKTKELELVVEELASSSLDEAKNMQKQLAEEKQKVVTLTAEIAVLNKEFTHFTSSKAVLQHTLEQKVKDGNKQSEIKKSLIDLNKKFAIYPLVTQAYSSTGISNLIIQNVLDDLQTEVNNILVQLKPGGKELQLSFFIEKKVEKTGDQADTLDINYHVNTKSRYYEQLSGAMQVAVSFSLKLGLSFLLQKILGADIKLLLLDEVDQSLDPASVDAYADIIKFFQKDFIILVITHNPRLKDKFTHAILVEQDINMVSRASVVSSW